MFHGWVCEASTVTLIIGERSLSTGYGSDRRDTQGVCKDRNNGFSTLFNWNILGDGEHTVQALADGVEFDRATFTVTTLGTEFLRAAQGEKVISNFPSSGNSIRLVWQESLQNFSIAPRKGTPVASPPTPASTGASKVPLGILENPSPGSWQSGIGMFSGWVCAASTVQLIIGNQTPMNAIYGIERRDTKGVCSGAENNGFALLFNWNLLGNGNYTVRALADGVEFGRASFTVTTLGGEFQSGIQRETVITDFPKTGKKVRLVWQESLQNFMIAPLNTSP